MSSRRYDESVSALPGSHVLKDVMIALSRKCLSRRLRTDVLPDPNGPTKASTGVFEMSKLNEIDSIRGARSRRSSDQSVIGSSESVTLVPELARSRAATCRSPSLNGLRLRSCPKKYKK